MGGAERSWYLEQMGVPEWLPRDAAALVSDTEQSAATTDSAPRALATAVPAEPQQPSVVVAGSGPSVTPAEILAKLKAANGPKSKKQLAEEGSKLAEEFTRPPTAEQLQQIAAKPKPVAETVVEVEKVQPAVVEPKATAVSNSAPATQKQEAPVSPQSDPSLELVPASEADFSFEEPDIGDLEALFAESMAFESESQPEIDAGPDTAEKLGRDWKLMLAQAGCLPASLGEGVTDPAVVVVTALPANQFDNRQLDRAWRLRGSILKAAKLPAKASFHSSFYSISSNVKPALLLKRLRDLHPKATLLCFSNAELEADLSGLSGEIIRLPSLEQMLADATLKRQAWEHLQKAIPSFEKLA
jgi:hypothetical protein